MSSPVDPAVNAPHGLAAHEVVLLLETDHERGLREQEAADRLARYGPNLLPAARSSGPLLRMARQFHNPLIYVLLAAGAVTFALAEYVDSTVIFGVVVVNAIVGYIQEAKAEAELDALRAMVRTRARVVRDGRARQIPSEDLVPGDLVAIEAGDKVPGDIRLLRESELAADESALTGESLPVDKDEVLLPQGTPVADRRNMLYAGTLITAGSGAGIAVATGPNTELGEIHRLVGSVEEIATPLTKKLTRFSKLLTVVILGLAILTFAVGVARGEDSAQMFTAAVALAVGAIPEGLPAAVTITLAIGVSRMAGRRVVVRRLPAVETLGSTTVICSDKTGTLTANQMTVRSVWTPDGQYDVTGEGYAPVGTVQAVAGPGAGVDSDEALRWTLLVGIGCSDALLEHKDGRWTVVGDPTEAALLVAADKGGMERESVVLDYPRVDVLPFTAERQLMATLHATPDGSEHVVLVKGAIERLLDLCSSELGADGQLRPVDGDRARRAADELAARGLRVLGTATRRLSGPQSLEPVLTDLVLTGMQAMQDPPRPAAISAVRRCQDAGIAVKMITGDHAVTATAIARQVGLLPEDAELDQAGQTLTGADLDALVADDYREAVERATVFARVSPEQKLRLVDALQASGEVVAMTGDGVNDAPALRQADIGVAMGRGGTEVAKEAADMVLMDDDFAAIEAAVEEGRTVFDNLTKFIVWTLPTNMGEGLVILVAIMLGTDLPILPVQILWINMTTAVALGLMLAFEPREPGVMDRPPRDPRRPLLTGSLVRRILLVSTLLVAGSWWLYEWEVSHGASLSEARTVAVNLFVVVEIFYLFSCRSLTRSMFQLGLLSNRWVIGGITVQVIGQLAITYLPTMNRLFQTSPLGVESWLRILLLGLFASLVVSVDKRLGRPQL